MNHGATERTELHEAELTETIIRCAIRVHRELGPGLLESVYERCLSVELSVRGRRVRRQVEMPLVYLGQPIGCAYRADLLVEDRVLVEVKAIEKLERIHLAQTLTYLRLADLRVALILNFNVPVLVDGLKRVVNGYARPALAP